MKIRWTKDSIRVRITPSELDAIESGESIKDAFIVHGMPFWTVVVTQSHYSSLTFDKDNAAVLIKLGREDKDTLLDPTSEGVYLQDGATDIRYYIEKDFPCAHPRAIESSEPVTETFEPPAGFLERKMD